jgi:chromosome segregation ATPase
MLRMPTEIPHRRGPLGGMVYAIGAALSLRSCRRELDTVEDKLKKEREERRERLMELARQAIADPDVDASVVMRAREILVEIEDRRSRKAGAAAASESEIDSVRAERERTAAKHREEVADVDDEIATAAKELEPLERRLAEARRRAGALQGQLRMVDARIKRVESDLLASRAVAGTPVELEADLAALRAERQAIAREQPELSDAIADLEPQIAGVKASRAELAARRDELVEMENASRLRFEERVAAIRARKAVDDREVADVARERNSALRELGEVLHGDRLAPLIPRLRGLDQHEEAIATLERRAIELKDKILRVDRATMWRGFALLGVVIAASAGVLLLALRLL